MRCEETGRRSEGGRDAARPLAQAGMTLPELLIAVALVSTLMATAIPMIDRGNARAAHDEFVLAHGLARSVAVQHARLTELHIDADGARYWIQVDTAGTGRYDTLKIRHLGAEGVSMDSDRALLCFDARGLASVRGACEPADGSVVFSDHGSADTVVTTAAGMVLR